MLSSSFALGGSHHAFALVAGADPPPGSRFTVMFQQHQALNAFFKATLAQRSGPFGSRWPSHATISFRSGRDGSDRHCAVWLVASQLGLWPGR